MEGWSRWTSSKDESSNDEFNQVYALGVAYHGARITIALNYPKLKWRCKISSNLDLWGKYLMLWCKSDFNIDERLKNGQDMLDVNIKI